MEKLTLRLTPLIAVVGFTAGLIGCSLSRQGSQSEVTQSRSQLTVAIADESEIGVFQPYVVRDRKHKSKTIVVSPPETFTIPDVIPPEGFLAFKKPNPKSQTVKLGTGAHFSATAVRFGAPSTNVVTYQWQINSTQLNGDLYWNDKPGETSSDLYITNAQVSDVGYYRAIAYSGTLQSTSTPAPLVVMIPGSWAAAGTPVSGSGSQTCVGSYAGKVLYPDNPDSQGYAGYIATASSVSAQDIQRTTTTNVASGALGDQKCGRNGSVSFSQIDGYYGFTIFFPTGTTVPTGHYTNKLTNFNP